MMVDLQNHPNLKVFKQHGFITQGVSGSTQVIGRCPFCGTNKKFFNNPSKKTWDCKICGKNGGYQKFLSQIISHCGKQFTGRVADSLAQDRSINVKTLKEFGVGYNRVNKTYIIPVWNADKTEVYNVRLFRIKDGLLRNSAGCKASMFGLPFTSRPHKVIWLCEGEWDAMAMYEILQENKLKDAIVLSAPGANTFKAEWTGLFSRKIVHVAYDNDYDKVDRRGIFHPGASKTGSKKVYENLKNVASSLEFVNWPSTYADGFDVRDLYKLRRLNPLKTIRNLVAMNKPRPMPIIHPDGTKEAETEKEEPKYTGKGLKPEEVYDGFRKWLELDDVRCIDVLYGTVIANRFHTDPIWLFIVGSSGSAKTDLVSSLDDCPEVMAISSLTTNTLISGSGGGQGSDPSLVPKLDGKVLAIKDFTVIMQMSDQEQAKIMSQFRDAYDGNCAKPFGTGAMRVYKSKFGFISGVTHKIEQLLEGGTALGERFLTFKLKEFNTFASVSTIMDRVLENTFGQKKDSMKTDLRALSCEVLNYDYKLQAEVPKSQRSQLKALAYWVSRMRGSVTRDNTYKKEVTHRAYVELPTRILAQIAILLQGICSFRHITEATDYEFGIIKHICLGSVPYHMEKIVKTMWHDQQSSKSNVEYSTDEVSTLLRLPYDTSYRFAENLFQLGVLRQRKGKYGTGQWRLSNETREIIKLGKIYPEITKKVLKRKKFTL